MLSGFWPESRGAAVGCVYTKKVARSTTSPVIIVSISICRTISKRLALAMTSTAICSAPPRRKTGQLTTNPLFQQGAHRIIRRRAKAAGIETRIGNHTFRATGITAYLKNSGKLEVAQHIANHESPRTTKLYDRRNDEISLDEIERIGDLKRVIDSILQYFNYKIITCKCSYLAQTVDRVSDLVFGHNEN
jgi:integrase